MMSSRAQQEPHNLSAIEIQGLSKSFTQAGRKVPVLQDFALTVGRGEWVAVMGRSGSGKTTMLRCASGLLKPDAGTVKVGGVDITRARADELARLRRTDLAYIFQDYNIVESLTVLENVVLPQLLTASERGTVPTGRPSGRDQGRAGAAADRRRRQRLGASDIAERGMLALRRTGIDDLAASLPLSLSGGERQRVAIARALAQEPQVLFADEPTGALDSAVGREVMSLFRAVCEQGSAVVMVTHDFDAASRADRTVVLADGTIRASLDNPTADMLYDALRQVDHD